jgi:hypothetical protein
MDNGWNSELAQNNIANLIKKLDIDLYTHVIDWEEYRNLMQAFFDADVIDVELLYDNAMLAVNYNLAKKYNIKYILAGTNQATEGMKMPTEWNWYKQDKRNILSIAKRNGIKKLESFPAISTLDFVKYRFLHKIQWISFLDFLNFNKFNALDHLEKNFGYKRYPFKHYESIFTRFYQGYILPNKFGVDKRKLHLSTLVVSGQIKREEAIEGIEGLAYPSIQDFESDYKYFLKKMKWKEEDLENYIKRSRVEHAFYGNELYIWEFILKLKKICM